MNNKYNTVRVGLFFILGCALAWITFESLHGNRAFRKEGYELIAPFANLRGLKEGDEVLMAGVKIGSVEKTRLGNQRVEAVLKIDRKIQIPDDAVASIQTSSLLGAQNLSVTFGQSPNMLAPGSELKTKESVDLNEVIAKLGSVGDKIDSALSAFTGGADGTSGPGGLFSKLDTLVTENGPKLSETLTNLQDITAKVKNGDGTIGRLVNNPALHDELLATVGEIKSAATDAKAFMNDTKGIVADVKSGKGTLGVLLYDEATADNLKVTVANVRGVSDKIAAGEGTLGKLLNDDGLYREAQATLKKADRALEGMGDSGPITAVGVVANALF